MYILRNSYMVRSEHEVICMHHSIFNLNNRWRTAVIFTLQSPLSPRKGIQYPIDAGQIQECYVWKHLSIKFNKPHHSRGIKVT